MSMFSASQSEKSADMIEHTSQPCHNNKGSLERTSDLFAINWSLYGGTHVRILLKHRKLFFLTFLKPKVYTGDKYTKFCKNWRCLLDKSDDFLMELVSSLECIYRKHLVLVYKRNVVKDGAII